MGDGGIDILTGPCICCIAYYLDLESWVEEEFIYLPTYLPSGTWVQKAREISLVRLVNTGQRI